MNNLLYKFSQIDKFRSTPEFLGETSLKFYRDRSNDYEERINEWEQMYNLYNMEKGNRK